MQQHLTGGGGNGESNPLSEWVDLSRQNGVMKKAN
jgi:hypothetical protein